MPAAAQPFSMLQSALPTWAQPLRRLAPASGEGPRSAAQARQRTAEDLVGTARIQAQAQQDEPRDVSRVGGGYPPLRHAEHGFAQGTDHQVARGLDTDEGQHTRLSPRFQVGAKLLFDQASMAAHPHAERAPGGVGACLAQPQLDARTQALDRIAEAVAANGISLVG